MSMTLALDQRSLDKILKRFKEMPDKLQKGATRATLTAGANVVKKNIKMRAPACIGMTARTVARKTSKRMVSKLSVAVGMNNRGSLGKIAKDDARALGVRAGISVAKHFNCYPAVWVELGTYGNRNLGKDPYSPNTLRKRSYSSGRSNSPFWHFPTRWIPTTPFMRPALHDSNIEKAMAVKLDNYMSKKGF